MVLGSRDIKQTEDDDGRREIHGRESKEKDLEVRKGKRKKKKKTKKVLMAMDGYADVLFRLLMGQRRRKCYHGKQKKTNYLNVK